VKLETEVLDMLSIYTSRPATISVLFDDVAGVSAREMAVWILRKDMMLDSRIYIEIRGDRYRGVIRGES
jgi:hypothetical protein